MTDEEKALIERAEGTMRVLTVENEDDKEVLRSECGDLPLEFVGSEQFRKLAALMIDTMTSPEQDGVGIAGPQVGLKRRIVAVQRFDKEGPAEKTAPSSRRSRPCRQHPPRTTGTTAWPPRARPRPEAPGRRRRPRGTAGRGWREDGRPGARATHPAAQGAKKIRASFPSVPVSEVERRVEDRFAFGSGTNLV